MKHLVVTVIVALVLSTPGLIYAQGLKANDKMMTLPRQGVIQLRPGK